MEQFMPNFREPEVSSAIKKLTTYSLMIVVLPLGSMLLLKVYFFQKLLGYSSSDSIMYAAVVAVMIVHVVLAVFVYAAWKEGSPRLPQAEYVNKED